MLRRALATLPSPTRGALVGAPTTHPTGAPGAQSVGAASGTDGAQDMPAGRRDRGASGRGGRVPPHAQFHAAVRFGMHRSDR